MAEDKKLFNDKQVGEDDLHLFVNEVNARVWAVVAEKVVRFYLDNGSEFKLVETIERDRFNLEREIRLSSDGKWGTMFFKNKTPIPFNTSVTGSVDTIWQELKK